MTRHTLQKDGQLDRRRDNFIEGGTTLHKEGQLYRRRGNAPGVSAVVMRVTVLGGDFLLFACLDLGKRFGGWGSGFKILGGGV